MSCHAKSSCPAVYLAVLAFYLLLFAGCPEKSSDKGPDETVDVPPGLEIDTSGDPQAEEEKPGLSGVLPGDFPKDLPIYVPASLVDFGENEEGRSWVSLLSPDRISRVRRTLFASIEARGWSSAAGSDGTVVLRKGSRRVWLVVEDGRPGTRYLFEY